MNEYKFNFENMKIYHYAMFFDLSTNQKTVELLEYMNDFAEFDLMGLPAREVNKCLESFSIQFLEYFGQEINDSQQVEDDDVDLDSFWDNFNWDGEL